MTQRDPSCSHDEVPAGYPWTQTARGPVCALCGALWPGHEIAIPEGRNPGLGALAEQPSWRSRVDAMANELAEVA